MQPTLAVKLFGIDIEDAKGRTLTAGALTAVLDNGMLRYIKLGDTEVMRAIAFLVRDENWGTFAPEITNLKIVEGEGAFKIAYDARCKDAKRSISYHADIACARDGTLTFSVKSRPDTDVLTNPRVVGLSVVAGRNRARAVQEIETIQIALPADIELWVGGADARRAAADVKAFRGWVVDDQNTTETELARIAAGANHSA